jgi:hypothetical protein
MGRKPPKKIHLAEFEPPPWAGVDQQNAASLERLANAAERIATVFEVLASLGDFASQALFNGSQLSRNLKGNRR